MLSSKQSRRYVSTLLSTLLLAALVAGILCITQGTRTGTSGNDSLRTASHRRLAFLESLKKFGHTMTLGYFESSDEEQLIDSDDTEEYDADDEENDTDDEEDDTDDEENDTDDEAEPVQGSGKKTALLITISYVQSRHQGVLHGTIKDGERMKRHLEKEGYQVTWMRDDRESDVQSWELYPSKANIEAQIMNLADNVAEGDVTWLYYSGHGSRYKSSKSNHDPNKSKHGPNECHGGIVPSRPRSKKNNNFVCCSTCCCKIVLLTDPGDTKYDVYCSEHVTDDWLQTNFTDRLPKNSETMVMFDSCHSGTMLRLPYQYQGISTCGKGTIYYNKSRGWERRSVANPNRAFVLYLSGCTDRQLNWSSSVHGGFLTRAFFETLSGTFTHEHEPQTQGKYTSSLCGGDTSLLRFLHNIQRNVLLYKKRFRRRSHEHPLWLLRRREEIRRKQNPKLSCSHKIDLRQSLNRMTDGNVAHNEVISMQDFAHQRDDVYWCEVDGCDKTWSWTMQFKQTHCELCGKRCCKTCLKVPKATTPYYRSNHSDNYEVTAGMKLCPSCRNLEVSYDSESEY